MRREEEEEEIGRVWFGWVGLGGAEFLPTVAVWCVLVRGECGGCCDLWSSRLGFGSFSCCFHVSREAEELWRQATQEAVVVMKEARGRRRRQGSSNRRVA